MKTIETLPNRVQEREAIDIAPIFDAIIGHRLRGSLSTRDHEALEQASPARLRLFLLCGGTLLHPNDDIQLPLDAIQSSQRQNSNGFYLHRLTEHDDRPKLYQGVYHALTTPVTENSYTLGLLGSMTDLNNSATQMYLHQLVESLRIVNQNADDAIDRIKKQLSETESAALVCNQAGQILAGNEAACRFTQKELPELVSETYQTIVQELYTKTAIGKSRLVTIPFGTQAVTLILLNTKQKVRVETPLYNESTKFLFQLLRDKIAVCNIASEFITSSLPSGTDASHQELANSLRHELQDLAHYLVRTEMLVHNGWNVSGRHNLSALIALAVGKAAHTLPQQHEIQLLSPESSIYCQCCPQGLEIALETIFWLHLHEQQHPTQTTLNFHSPVQDTIQLTITTSSMNDEALSSPKSSWQTYLTHFAHKMNISIETTQDAATSAITTHMKFLSIKE